MDAEPVETPQEVQHERLTRIRVGATGLAAIVIVVLLAATFSGTASNEPEFTPETMAESVATETGNIAAAQEPQEPLAELGVAPTTTPEAEPGAIATGGNRDSDPE